VLSRPSDPRRLPRERANRRAAAHGGIAGSGRRPHLVTAPTLPASRVEVAGVSTRLRRNGDRRAAHLRPGGLDRPRPGPARHARNRHRRHHRQLDGRRDRAVDRGGPAPGRAAPGADGLDGGGDGPPRRAGYRMGLHPGDGADAPGSSGCSPTTATSSPTSSLSCATGRASTRPCGSRGRRCSQRRGNAGLTTWRCRAPSSRRSRHRSCWCTAARTAWCPDGAPPSSSWTCSPTRACTSSPAAGTGR
jgi:hypothetical protein